MPATMLTDDGHTHARSLDIAPGFPDHPLSDAQQRARFDDCMAYAPRPPAQVGRFLDAVVHGWCRPARVTLTS